MDYKEFMEQANRLEAQAATLRKQAEEANEYGYEMALGVVESYGCFDDEAYIEQELEWRIYKIKEGISAEEARAAVCSHNEEGFVAEYCEKQVFVL